MVCPLCGGELNVIGILGNLRHMQCRNCGTKLHSPLEGELLCGGDHQAHEDCLICAICGTCTESLDEEDVCSECIEPEVEDSVTMATQPDIYDKIVQWYLEEKDLRLQDVNLNNFPQLNDWLTLLKAHLFSPKGNLRSFAQALKDTIKMTEELIALVEAHK